MKDLKFLGIGGAVNFEFGSNCAYLKQNNKLLLLDCGEDCAKKLVDRNVLDENINEILIVITHTHADHVAGIGTLIWHCNFVLGIIPKIFCNSESFKNSLTALLTLIGVDPKFYVFTKSNGENFDNINIKAIPVTHDPMLESFSILLDDGEKVLYSGDTNDFEFIKTMASDETISKIYCEVSTGNYPVHIFYNDLKTLSQKEKFVLMHFSTTSDYELIKSENLFKLAEIDK